MAADEKWYFTKEQLTNTPSRRCGIDADKELSYRQQAANFIQDMGQRLVVSQLCINTAIVYMHRFYVYHSLSQFHRNAIAAAALFLAAKVEEQPRKLEHVIKMAHMCLHRDQPPPDVRSEQYLEQAQDLVFNENVLLQTLGFDVAIDHPHTHVVRCCQLVKASKDLAQTSYFMASNSLHLTTMCLQYKPTVVACFCIHLASKWSNWEIPQSNEGKHWFWYVDRSVTSELLQQLTAEFLHIFDKCPSRLKRKIMSISANQSPNMSHPSLPNSPFDAEPRKVQSPATTTDGGPTFHSSRPHHGDKQQQDEKKSLVPAPGRPPVDYREYREKKERERMEREKAAASGSLAPTSTTQGHISEMNKHHHHKPVSNVPPPGKHPLSMNQKNAMHHNHHHRPDMKVGQPVPQRHSSGGQPREPSRDPNRQRMPREYNANSGMSSGAMHAHAHAVHHSKDSNLDSSTDPTIHRSDIGMSQETGSHGNSQDKLSNNNHSIHRLSGSDKHLPHDKRAYDPRHKPVEHRKEGEQKMYGKYPDPKVERQRKSDTLEQRCEEVRKLIEKPLPLPKPSMDPQYAQKAHHAKYIQQDKIQSGTVLNDPKLQNTFSQEKSPTSASQLPQKAVASKSISNQHSAHGVSQILKDTIKNGSSQPSCLTTNIDDPKAEKRPRHDEIEKVPTELPQNLLQTPPGKHKSLFSPEKVPNTRESHSQRPKSKQKTPPSAAKVPKQERIDAPTNLVTPFASPPGMQQPISEMTTSVKRSASDVSTSSHKRHRTTSNSESDQQHQIKIKVEDPSNFEAVKPIGNTRLPDLLQPIRDNPSNGNGNSSAANDLKPPELIKPFEPEPIMARYGSMSQHRVSTMSQQTLTNGIDTSVMKQEPKDYHAKRESQSYKQSTEISIKPEQMKVEYLSPMKSAQSISALLQEPLAPMPSLLQGIQQQPIAQVPPQQSHQEQIQLQQTQLQQSQCQQQQQQQQQQQLPPQSHEQQHALSHPIAIQDSQVQSQCLTTSTDTMIASTVDISVFSTPLQTTQETTVMMPTTSTSSVPPSEEKRSEHHKSEKKKKKEKHKHKDKEKSKEKHKHKHKDKDKDRHRDKDKEKATDDTIPAKPIKITIPKDKLNLSTDSGATTCVVPPPEKNKSPQSTGLKIKIPKERLKGTESVSSSPIQPVQAPLKIKIRTDGMSRSSSGVPVSSSGGSAAQAQVLTDFGTSDVTSRKRERSDVSECPSGTTGYAGNASAPPPTKKQSQMSSVGYGQHRPGERQNGRHYSGGSSNKVRGGGGRGSRQYISGRGPGGGSAARYPGASQRDGYYQQDNYSSNNRNPHHPHPPPSGHASETGYGRTGHVVPSQTDPSYYFANYPPPSVYSTAGYMYDPTMYYSQYQQHAQQYVYPAGNVIVTPDGAIDTSVPPPSLPPNLRNSQTVLQQANTLARQQETPPPLPSGPPPSSSPPPPPPPPPEDQ